MNLSDQHGMPRTAYMKLGWTIVLIIASSGTILILLAIYLSAWVRTKGRSALPLYGFLAVLITALATVAIDHFHRAQVLSDSAGTAALLIYIAATFMLRHEIVQHFQTREHWTPRINLFLTLLFSSAYLNECLSPDRIPVKSPITSLNL